jgi:hypothetical protein
MQIPLQFVASKNVFNLQQFSKDSPSTTLLILRSSLKHNTESSLETDFRNDFIQQNRNYNFIFQFKISSNNTGLTEASKLIDQTVVILFALNSEAIHRVGIDLTRIKNEPGFTNSVAIIAVLKTVYNISTLISSLNSWKSQTFTAFLYEITLTQSEVSSETATCGTYFYLCFLCHVKQTLIKVDKPSMSLNDLEFQDNWGDFIILAFSGEIQWDTINLKYYCTGRHRTFRSMRCT